jgi:RecB family exonuclease
VQLSFVKKLRDDLASLAAAGSWAEMVAATYGLIRHYLGGEHRRWRWPEEEQQAADRVEETLDRLAGLDAIGGGRPTVEVFRRSLEGELEAALRRVGHFGDGVLTGPVSMAVGLELDRVVVLGMAEGSFPPRRLEDSLLHDNERAAAHGELALRADRLHDDHRHLLAAVAAADETTLLFPRGDLRRHGDRVASRWLLDDAARLAGRSSVFTDDLATIDGDWLRRVPSYAAGLAQTPFPTTQQEWRLSAMLRDPNAIVSTDAALSLGIEVVTSRRSDHFTRFDGNLAGLALPDFTSSGVVSASRLQAWAACPHAFFMQYLLGVEVVADPEQKLEMDPLDRGSLIHKILERFIGEATAAGRVAPWDEQRLVEIADEVFADYGERGATGRAMFWRRDRARILADLQRFADEDRGRPIHVEYDFEAPYPLPDGRQVRFRGLVDRVDDAGGGALRIIDYKTGKVDDYKHLSAGDPHQRGMHLQLAVYGTAMRQELDRPVVEALYWFVTARGAFQEIGYLITSEVLAEVGQAIATIVDGIGGGVFPRRPPASPSWGYVDCWYCSPDGLSTAEARRDWERKRRDPALAGYVALCEPEALDDDT